MNNQLRSLTHAQFKKELQKAVNSEHILHKRKAFQQNINSKVKTRPSITELLFSDGTAASSDAEMATMLND